jgi:hypothetical protein
MYKGLFVKIKLFALLVLILTLLVPGCYVQNINGSNDINRQQISKALDEITVALVLKREPYNQYKPYCGGTWINKNTVLTARHCLANDDDENTVSIGKIITFQTFELYDPAQYTEKAYYGYVSGYSEKSDLGLITTIDDVSHPSARIYYGNAWAGQHVEIVGHPKGLLFSHTESMIARIAISNFPHPGAKVIQVNGSAIWFGNSGAGCFNYDDGKLLGVASFLRLDDGHPYAGFYVETSDIVSFLNEQGVAFSY